MLPPFRTIVLSTPAGGATGSCLAAAEAPVNTTYATAMVYDHANSKLIVAYAGAAATANVNSIVAYDFDETSGAITNGQVIYDAFVFPETHNFFLFAISAMTLDAETNHLYVATAISNAATVANYAIERLDYNAALIGADNTKVLTREGSLPFYNYGVDTKCISAMVIGSEAPPSTVAE